MNERRSGQEHADGGGRAASAAGLADAFSVSRNPRAGAFHRLRTMQMI